MLRRYDRLAFLMKIENDFVNLLREHGDPDKIPDVHRDYAKERREYLRSIDREYVDQLEKPITESWRTIVDDPEDIALSGKHFRILKVEDPDDWTDEEIEEYIMDEVGYPPICEPWDCTGKRFTRWCSWSRQPIGIVMIHAWGTDL